MMQPLPCRLRPLRARGGRQGARGVALRGAHIHGSLPRSGDSHFGGAQMNDKCVLLCTTLLCVMCLCEMGKIVAGWCAVCGLQLPAPKRLTPVQGTCVVEPKTLSDVCCHASSHQHRTHGRTRTLPAVPAALCLLRWSVLTAGADSAPCWGLRAVRGCARLCAAQRNVGSSACAATAVT